MFLASQQTCIPCMLLMSLSPSHSCYRESLERTQEILQDFFYQCQICPMRHSSLETMLTAFFCFVIKICWIVQPKHPLSWFYSKSTMKHVWCHPRWFFACLCTYKAVSHVVASCSLVANSWGLITNLFLCCSMYPVHESMVKRENNINSPTGCDVSHGGVTRTLAVAVSCVCRSSS